MQAGAAAGPRSPDPVSTQLIHIKTQISPRALPYAWTPSLQWLPTAT